MGGRCWGGGEEVPWEHQGWGEEGGGFLEFPWSGPPSPTSHAHSLLPWLGPRIKTPGISLRSQWDSVLSPKS